MDTTKFSPEQKQAWASLVSDRSKRQAMAELITEVIKPNHITNTYMNYLLRSRALNSGDLLNIKLRKGLKVHTYVPGSVHMAHEITTSDRVNFVLDGADIKVTYNQEELERGDIGTLAEIRQEMQFKLRDYYFNKVFTALSTIWNNGNTPNNFVNLGTAITATALEDAIDRINDTTGGVKAVIGARSALTPITKFGAFWDNGAPSTSAPTTGNQIAMEEVRQTGWLGRYYGADIIGINQIFDDPESNTGLLPTNKIIVIGHDVGDFITYGPVRTKAWTDWNPTPPQEFYEIYQQFGFLVTRAEGIYVIQVA